MEGHLTRGAPRVALAALVVAALAGAGPVSAHEAAREVRNVVDEVTVDVPGLVVETGRSVADQLLVTNPSDVELEILDPDGRAFLRIGPAGVLGDLATPAFHASNDPFGTAGVPETANGGEPRWGRVSREPSWGWFDHRMHPGTVEVPPDAEPGELLARWSVPIGAGDQQGEIRGHREYQPVLGGYRASLDGGGEPAPGLTVTVLSGPVPALLVENATGDVVTVLGPDREPFLRVLPDRVEANLASTWWHEVARLDPAHSSRVTASDPGGAPRWERVADVPRFAWLELRAHADQAAPADPTLPAVSHHWSVPVLLGDDELAIEGVTEWVPAGHVASDGSGSPLPLVIGALGAVVLGGAWWLRSGRAR